MKTVTIAQWGQIHSLYLPIYIADRKGLFAENGLKLNLKLAGNDDQTFLEVAKSRADFGLGDPSFCAMVANKSVNAKVVATIVNRTGVWGISRSPVISEITHAQDLVNLRIGSLPAPATTYALIQNLKNTNRRLLRSMKIIQAPIGEQFSLLAKGKVDVALDIEPYVSIAESKGYKVIYSLADLHGRYTFTGLYSRQDFIDKNPKLVSATVSAIDKALKLLNKDLILAEEISNELFPELNPKVIKNSLKRLKRAQVWQDTAETEPSAWLNSISVRSGIGDKFVKDALAHVDNSFIPKS